MKREIHYHNIARGQDGHLRTICGIGVREDPGFSILWLRKLNDRFDELTNDTEEYMRCKDCAKKREEYFDGYSMKEKQE
jgi:hypothetical protein